MSPRKIIIDTDPGQDDAAAIMLALASPELKVLGITAVAGNVPLVLTARNARMITEICGRSEVPVYAGADRPLTRKLVTAEHVHGKTGLDGVEPFEAERPLEPVHAVDFIIETLRRQPAGEITLCALGPLTNIATVIERAPDVVVRIKEIVLMGGGFFEGGNITPSAEFNIYVDPEAADIVFKAGVPITMMPLDVTHKVLTTRVRVERLRANGNRASLAMADMLEFFERFDEEKYGTDGGPLHDPTVIAWLIDPDMFSGRQCNVEIETGSELTLGATVVDWWKVTGRAENAFVVRDVDADRFFGLFIERVGRL
ncbi:Inosine-uridine nucleoside N-ribohydrolase [Hoeflea sp. IMCC20628]|uniref:nucleoside hydrolase n=1 Tax=Hoeflea sp. IMCC20628 TaxID=1620421 RepID=UPI00063AE6A5|nr:nucleoside hydrolase [Hoeflea sp. IMCC20628]AKI02458.1 Inosine-uridine nucleoside N-ribohydrolase [Hoeflea sp. IMCC20628]